MSGPLILGTNAITGGYDVDNSLRFNAASEDYIDRTPSGAGNQKKFTFSTWVKRSRVGAGSGPEEFIMYGRPGSNTDTRLYFTGDGNANDDRLYFQSTTDNTTHTALQTNRKFRDISAWYNIVISVNTEDGNGSSSTIKMFINGVQETSFATETYGVQNKLFYWTDDALTTIGRRSENNGQHFSGYIAETVLIDGQALDADSFGEFDDDSPTVWKPKDVSGLTFGTNGFHLDFEDSSALGADVSGNSNNFSVSNLTSIDQTTDTCTNNFITLNPLVETTNRTNAQTFSEGNTISIPNSHDSYMTAASTIGLQGSGKWYWEAQVVWNGTSSNAYYPRTLGFVTEDYAYSASYLNQDEESWAIIYQASGGPGWRFGHGGSEANISGATTMANGDTMMMALDLDNGKFYAGRNGTFFTSGDPTSGSTGTGALATLTASDLAKFIFPAVTNASNATYYKFNFGNPAYSITSGNSDANGHGNFEYAVPSGYFSICTKNLAESG